jgi:hypothetical protein
VRFLLPYVAEADALVFSRRAFVPSALPTGRVEVLTPAIDPRSEKNRPLAAGAARGTLDHHGLAPVRADDRLVLALARWDRLKDPVGILHAFARHVEEPHAFLVVGRPVSSCMERRRPRPPSSGARSSTRSKASCGCGRRRRCGARPRASAATWPSRRTCSSRPADVLVRVSEHLDLLICGSRGYGPVRAVLLGGVSRRLTAEAHCPVIVLPRGVQASLEALMEAPPAAAV